jgi:glucose/mannose-6-phosphate isomerase
MPRALNLKSIKAIDKSDMLGLLLDFPLQCKAAQEIAARAEIKLEKRDFGKIVFVGLGASAAGGDLIRSYLYLENSRVISVFREYVLPSYVNAESLVFTLSYSGNTDETISAYAQAKESGASIIVISSGGKLKELALKDNTTFIQIPPGSPPRFALGYLSVIPLCVLAKLGLIEPVLTDIKETIALLETLKNQSLAPHIASKDNIAKEVARRLWNKFAVIYSSSVHFDICARRLRSQLAENAKTLSSSQVFPDINHNEIVGWQNPAKVLKNFLVLMLRDDAMHPRVGKSMDITREIVSKQGIPTLEIYSRGKGLLSRIFSLIYIGDFISFYLAILYSTDPMPIKRIDYLKKKLAEGN